MGSWLETVYITAALVAVALVVPVLRRKPGRTVARPAWQKAYLVTLGALAASVLVASTFGRIAAVAGSFEACDRAPIPRLSTLTVRLPW